MIGYYNIVNAKCISCAHMLHYLVNYTTTTTTGDSRCCTPYSLTMKHKKMEEGKMHSWDRPETDSKLSMALPDSTFYSPRNERAPIQNCFVVRYSFVDMLVVEHPCAASMQHFSALHVVKCLFCTHINRVFLQQPRQHHQQQKNGHDFQRVALFIPLVCCCSVSVSFDCAFASNYGAQKLHKNVESRVQEREMHARLSVSVTYVDGEINHKK